MMIISNTAITAFGDSTKGSRRQENEDRFLIKTINDTSLLLAISDGMGGNPAGAKAADDIMHSFSSPKNEENNSLLLRTAANQADAVIRKRVERDPELEGMGATVTAAIVTSRMVWWVHIGDSRMYLMRKGAMRQITRDHSFLQDLIDGGDISEAEAAVHPMAHVLDQCIGCMDAGVDSGSFSLFPGDILLLCTDGIYRSVSNSRIQDILATTVDVKDCVEQLLISSPRTVSSDDATVIIAFV